MTTREFEITETEDGGVTLNELKVMISSLASGNAPQTEDEMKLLQIIISEETGVMIPVLADKSMPQTKVEDEILQIRANYDPQKWYKGGG